MSIRRAIQEPFLELAESILDAVHEARRGLKFDPNQARDGDGQWTAGGGSDGGNARSGPKDQSTQGRSVRRTIDKLWELSSTDTVGSYYDDLNSLEKELAGAGSDADRTKIRTRMSSLHAEVRAHLDREKND